MVSWYRVIAVSATATLTCLTAVSASPFQRINRRAGTQVSWKLCDDTVDLVAPGSNSTMTVDQIVVQPDTGLQPGDSVSVTVTFSTEEVVDTMFVTAEALSQGQGVYHKDAGDLCQTASELGINISCPITVGQHSITHRIITPTIAGDFQVAIAAMGDSEDLFCFEIDFDLASGVATST